MSALLTRGTPTAWGIDLSTYRIDIAFVAEDRRFQTNGCQLRTAKDPAIADQGGQLRTALEVLPVFFRAMAEFSPPCAIYVERPAGAARNIRLVQTAGIVLAAAASATDVPVWSVSSSDWKKRLGLPPSVGKKAGAAYPPLVWARRIHPTVSSTDEADALGIACMAARDLWGADSLPLPTYDPEAPDGTGGPA
jgi:hypothetical protein